MSNVLSFNLRQLDGSISSRHRVRTGPRDRRGPVLRAAERCSFRLGALFDRRDDRRGLRGVVISTAAETSMAAAAYSTAATQAE